MIHPRSKAVYLWILENSTIVLFVAVFLVFAYLSSNFLTLLNMKHILIQSSSAAIVAIGMTFVLLTAGIDLSVGSIMFLSGVISGLLVVNGCPVPLAFLVVVAVGVAYGAFNAFFVTRLGIMPFIVTLATLYIGRGLGLFICKTRAVNLPDDFLQIGSSLVFGVVPFPILVFALVLLVSHSILTYTPFGRQIYAVGNSVEAAQKAGINPKKILVWVYLISALCAAIGGMVSIAQLGAISPSFGRDREFDAIAAAVLGGTSLFGGRGKVFPGTVLGAILIQAVRNGLGIVDADPYIYPLVIASIVFLVVFIDSVRYVLLQQLKRRKIRIEPAV